MIASTGTEPKLESSEAIEIARKDFGAEPSEEYTVELIIYPERASAKNHLAYLVTMPLWRDNLPLRLRYFINANSGEILERFNDQTVTGEATSKKI